MIDPEIQNTIKRLQSHVFEIAEAISTHDHKGIFSQRVNWFDIFGYTDMTNVYGATIATTGNSDAYMIVPVTGNVIQIDFSGTTALASDNTNYITWTVTNLKQDGSGSTALLGAVDANTTKTTGGTGITADSKRTLTLTTTLNNLQVVQGDRLRIRAAVTNTLANTVTFPVYLLQVQTQ